MSLKRIEHKITQLPILRIKSAKYQPRQNFNEAQLSSLAESIIQNGILQPLTVRKISSNEYELIAGERRLRAALWAGLKRVPCIVIDCDDNKAAVLSLIENLQRTDLNPFEEAHGIKRLIEELGLTQEQVASRLGKKQSTIANKLRLLRLTNEEQHWIVKEGLSERHARCLLAIDDEKLRKNVLSRVIINRLNVSQSEELVRRVLSENLNPSIKKTVDKTPVVKDIRIFMNTMNKAVDTMKKSGIKADTEKRETDEYIEYSVRIPKKDSTDKKMPAQAAG